MTSVEYNKKQGYKASMWRDVQDLVGAKVDGCPGPETAECVTLWQQEHGLEPDGKVGPATLQAMGLVEPDRNDFVAIRKANPDMSLGIDVSKYQKTIDWKAVKAAGVDFAIIRASLGRTLEDRRWKENQRGARAAGVLMSAYHVASMEYDEAITDAAGGAKHFLHVCKPMNIDFAPWLDLETSEVRDLIKLVGAEKAAEWIHKWLETYENLSGRKAGLYLSHRGVKSLGRHADDLKAMDLDLKTWWADYDTKWRTWPDMGDWPGIWSIRQFTSKGQVPGIEGNVDLDVALLGSVNVMIKEWRSACG